MAKLIIGADIVPTPSNQRFFETAHMEQIIDNDLLYVLREADYRIFNLETPLTDIATPIKKCGPNLIASTKSVAGLKQLGIDFLTLANNHILDQDEQGLWSTTHQLDKAGISYAGIGRNPKDAARPRIVEIESKRVGIYCCAEHEFSIVSDKQAGANPFDPLESLDHIETLKSQCDYLICLYHGGKEYYRYPSPNLQKVCRKLVEKGADIVICQHTHCIGCEERWRDGTIVYGQGNFLFDDDDNEFYQTSVLIQIEIPTKEVCYIPISKKGNGVELATKEDKRTILYGMQKRSEDIQREGFVEHQYKAFSMRMISGYLNRGDLLSQSFCFRVLNKLSGYRLSNAIANHKLREYRFALRNQYECEAHRELILKGMEVSDGE